MARECSVGDETRREIQRRLQRAVESREQIRSLARTGRREQAETDPRRQRDYAERRAWRLERGSRGESLRGDLTDFQPVSFLSEGATRRRAVAKVELEIDSASEEGTGFLISPRLFLTNQHVIRDPRHARAADLLFDYEIDEHNMRRETTAYRLDPDRFWASSPEASLDYSLIALGARRQGGADPRALGYCPISNTSDRHVLGMPINVIQHPGGGLKQVALRNNLLSHRTDRTLLYETDTQSGSSGSPVFNDDWDVVALHHYGEPFLAVVDGVDLELQANEGVRISQIYDELERKLPTLGGDERELLEEALVLYEQTQPARRVPRRPDATRALPRRDERRETDLQREGAPMSGPLRQDSNAATFVIPIEVTVRVQGASTQAQVSTGQALDEGPRRLPMLASEGKKLDRNYANRNGFDARFVRDIDIDLSELVSPFQDRITPLKSSQDDHERGELKYQNFSVMMDREYRLARITATNIHERHYIDIDRETGAPREGETWYIERRIRRDAFVDQSFYGVWSHIFDRGHLTRRNDPTWGDATEAKRANADTFHFTNSAPQQWRFNQSTRHWQGLERYILEQGIQDEPGRTKLTVLQGPVFNDDEDLFAGDVQIPTEFWKLAVWFKQGRVRVVGLIASQSGMLDEFRGPQADRGSGSIDVSESLISVRGLERKTGLDLRMFREHDLFTSGGDAGRIGGEAAVSQRPVRDWADIPI